MSPTERTPIRDAAGFLVGAWVLRTMAPALSHQLWGCRPGFFFGLIAKSRCGDCWRRVERGTSLSGWVPAPTARQLAFKAFLEGKPE